MQSMSIKCCSARLFSLFTFRWSAVNIFRLCSKYCPQLRLRSRSASLAMPRRSVASLPPLGGIEKYSSSSRSTMIACFVSSGFCAAEGPKSDVGEPPSSSCCCAASSPPGAAGVP